MAVFLALLGFALLLGVRLYYWQVQRHDWLAQQAHNEHFRDETIPARRGAIYDVNGSVLATNEAVDSVYAARKQIDDPAKAAQVLSPLIDMPADDIEKRIRSEDNPNLQFVRLKAWVTPDVSQRIRASGLGGIFLEPTTRRTYPQNGLAAHLLGYVNDDSEGQYGLEEFYNEALSGTAGHLRAETDVAGRPINFSTPPESSPAKNGADLVTSIDAALQYIAERELTAAVKQHKASGGTIIIMDPHTGAIMALANVPSFDPNNYAASDPSGFLDAAISKQYEPGSTFKIITMSIGLAENAVTPTTAINDPGYLSLAGIRITNWDGKGHSPESATQVLQYSSNVGAATIGWKVGADKYYPHIKDYGFGSRTGVDLAGELPGQVLFPGETNWTPSNLVTNSFGQGIAVTPLQLTTAVAAVANGGLLVKPHVVREIRGQDGTQDIGTTEVRRVLEPQVAATLTKMLVDSAKIGEAQFAVVPGFNVAAKTGTAQVASPTGGYADGKFIASLMGFAPADDPKFVMLVKIDEPQDVPFGSEVAAPVWREIAKQLFVHFKIEPTDPVALAKSAVTPTPVPAANAPSASSRAPVETKPTVKATAPKPTPARSSR
ncbi:MAG TPA: penicillin-binding transpeptidase domain-containing protein [Chloroflexota bacterium]|nr:penicillin-binding transpeptidase domain-containing protein [Chloroflexota bacterium]